MRKTMTVLVTFALAATVACGGAPLAGPSPVAVAPPAGTLAASMPSGLDPAYVHALVPIDAAGQPKRWEGGPFHHCFGPGVDVVVAGRAADRMTLLSGIPRTEAGPCNVEWVLAEGPDGTVAITTIAGNDIAIYHARVTLESDRVATLSPAVFLHEAGHVLGLTHSARAGDLMHQEYDHARGDFTPDELAVLAWMYGR